MNSAPKKKRPLAGKALSTDLAEESQNAGSQSSSIVEWLQGLLGSSWQEKPQAMDATTSEQKREQREEPAPEEEQTLFGFLEEISLSPKKRDRDATSSILQPNSSHIAAETVGEKAVLRKRARRRHEITGTFPAGA